MQKGIESLKAAVLHDTERYENCFNENGCDHEFTRMMPETNPGLIAMGITQCCKMVSKCSHKYCDKYKWVIDRAKHYAEKTGKTYEEIIEIWERIDFLKKEIETYDFLSTTLTQEHQQSVKNDIITKVENMKRELTDCQSRMRLRLYEISCFAS